MPAGEMNESMMLSTVSSKNHLSMVSFVWGISERFQAGAEAAGSKTVLSRNLRAR